jgi:hypothetical protein
MRATIAGCLAGLMALALAASATAATTSFAGSCTVTGTAKFAKPLSGPPSANHYTFASGPPADGKADETACTGTMDGAPLSSPAKVQVGGDADLSCAHSTGTGAAGTVTLTRGTATTSDDVSVPFKLDIEGVATEVNLTVHGERSGGGTGSASFRDYAAPTTPLDCAGNNGGVKQLGFKATFKTDQAMVSEAPSSSSSSSSGSSAQAASSSPSSPSPAAPAADPSSSGQTPAGSTTPTAKAKS